MYKIIVILKVFVVTFLLVLLFRNANDKLDSEADHEDNGSAIYVDEEIGDLEKNLPKILVI